jgi:uncharacterized protein (DUF302 family)
LRGVADEHDSYTVRRLTVGIPGVREFQRRFEDAVPFNPADQVAALTNKRGATWAEMLELIADSAPHGFLIYWRNDVRQVMQLAGDENDCVAYLMGNVTVAEQMFRHEPRVMLYSPLRALIWEASDGRAWFTVDQPSTLFGSFGNARVSAIGVEVDRKLAELLEALGAEVPMALCASAVGAHL